MAQYDFEYELDAHAKAGAVKGWRAGNDFAIPELNASGSALLVTSTPLAASATFTGTVYDRLDIAAGATPTETPAPIATGVFVTKYRGIAFADQTGTLYVDESNDGQTWTQTVTLATVANTLADTGWVYLTNRYYRLRFVNGATAQTVFSVLDSAGAGLADVNAQLAESLPTDYAELSPIFNALAITDGNGHSSAFADVRDYTEVWFEVTNSLNQSVTLSLTGATSNTQTSNPTYDYNYSTTGAQPNVTVVASTGNVLWGPFTAPGWVGLYAKCSAAPTSGTLTVTPVAKRI